VGKHYLVVSFPFKVLVFGAFLLMSHFCMLLLQAPEYSHLKVSLLQDSFVRELWKKLGKQTYIEKVHPLVIANLYNSPNKITASAASIVLIGSSEELGIPITVHQASLK
jgi:WD repeat-containing protein 81